MAVNSFLQNTRIAAVVFAFQNTCVRFVISAYKTPAITALQNTYIMAVI
jgi:hypothetical protein